MHRDGRPTIEMDFYIRPLVDFSSLSRRDRILSRAKLIEDY